MNNNHHHNHSINLSEGKDSLSNTDNHKGMIAEFRKRFWLSLIISIPVVILSPMIQSMVGYKLFFSGSQTVTFLLSSIVYFYGGAPFLKGLLKEVKLFNPGMMTLIGLAITIAYLYSSAIAFGLQGMDYFWELVTLISIMLLGHWIEMKSIMGASKAIELLVSLLPSEAHLVHGNHIMDVKLDEIKPNDIILIKPGEKVPADGKIVEGESYVDESMLTGESKPIKKGKGDSAIGGSVNGSGSLKLVVKNTGMESYLNKVIQLVNQAQNTKSRTQDLANSAAKWLTYVALIGGIATFSGWLFLGYEFSLALERMVTVMVITCPHALGLAIPLVVAISTARSASKGLLIRNRTAFENARRISALVFDKTGTLTKGNFGVTNYKSFSPNFSNEKILEFASSLEQASEHPIAVGIINKAKEKGILILENRSFNAITGKGVEAIVDDAQIKIVSPGYLKEHNISIPLDYNLPQGETIVYILIENVLAGYISLADEIRPESKNAIRKFKASNIKVYMATGDNSQVAETVSKQLGLDGFFAEVLPHQKVEIIKNLQQNGEIVAMTGDGVNDAPALAQADIGIAVGSGTDIAAETADIILVNSNPEDVYNLISFGRATYKKMIQNLFYATAYNIVTLPLAAGLFSSYGITIDPAVGAVLMSLSTIVVAINAQLLKFKLR